MLLRFSVLNKEQAIHLCILMSSGTSHIEGIKKGPIFVKFSLNKLTRVDKHLKSLSSPFSTSFLCFLLILFFLSAFLLFIYSFVSSINLIMFHLSSRHSNSAVPSTYSVELCCIIIIMSVQEGCNR
jgi:hypothetical protein